MIAKISLAVYHTIINTLFGEVKKLSTDTYENKIYKHLSPHQYANTFSVLPYHLVAYSIKQMKYEGATHSLAHMGEIIADLIATRIEDESFYIGIRTNPSLSWVVCTIPSSSFRKMQFGFSQTERILTATAMAWNKRFIPNILIYKGGIIKRTSFYSRKQASQTRAERLESQQKAFTVSRSAQNYISGKRIIIIDDVLTTGATMQAAQTIIKAAGAQTVYGVCFAWSARRNMVDSMNWRRG